MKQFKEKKVIIIGSGVAGLSAAICLARSTIKTMIITGNKFGGQIFDASKIDNCPGFKLGITGPEMIDVLYSHAINFGTEIKKKSVIKVNFNEYPFSITLEDNNIEYGDAVIIATGKSQNQLNLHNIDRYLGHGLSYCVTCDGPFLKNKDVCVVGGGDNALKSAYYLSNIAKSVHIFVRSNMLRALEENQTLLKTKENIFVHFETEIIKINGEQYVENVDIKEKGIIKNLKIDGIFVMIGSSPNTDIFEKFLKLDEQKYIITDNNCQTSIKGIFAAGDVQSNTFKQVPVAIGNGTTAAMSVLLFLKNK